MSWPTYVADRLGAIFLVAAAFSLATRWLPRHWGAAVLVACTAAAILIPIGGLTLVDLVFSGVGALSAATVFLAATAILRNAGAIPAAPRGTPTMAGSVVLLGALLYASAFGVGPVDAYGLGYRGWALPGLLLAILSIAALLRSTATAVWVGLAAAFFILRVGPSRNFWDYVIDPVASLWATVLLAITAASALGRGMGRRSSGKAAGPQPASPEDAGRHGPAARAWPPHGARALD